jgi:hypothetical protein
MVTLTAFFAWLALWAQKNVNEWEKGFVVAGLATLAVIGFILATAFLAGAVG